MKRKLHIFKYVPMVIHCHLLVGCRSYFLMDSCHLSRTSLQNQTVIAEVIKPPLNVLKLDGMH